MTADPDLDRAVEIIIVDAYGDDDQYTAFLTVIEDQARLPATAILLGTPVTVAAFDYTYDRGIIARREVAYGTGEISLADLAFPAGDGHRLGPRRTPNSAATRSRSV